MATLDLLTGLVQAVEFDTYEPFEDLAGERIARRDEDDWPVLAAALALGCPIWTEDTDFFGCGVATWTTGLSCTWQVSGSVKDETACPFIRLQFAEGRSIRSTMRICNGARVASSLSPS
jgi:hypothetical protein